MSYLIHFNRNHDKNGRFTSGDGDNDGILDDHHNYAKNKQAQSKGSGGGGISSTDKMIGDQIDAMVKKYNASKNPVKSVAKKKDDNKKKKARGAARKASKKKSSKTKQLASNIINGAKSLTVDEATNQTTVPTPNITDLINKIANTDINNLNTGDILYPNAVIEGIDQRILKILGK